MNNCQLQIECLGYNETIQISPNKQICVGRQADCQIVVPEQFSRVSRIHLEITCKLEGSVLINPKGTNGTTFGSGQNDMGKGLFEIKPGNHETFFLAGEFKIELRNNSLAQLKAKPEFIEEKGPRKEKPGANTIAIALNSKAVKEILIGRASDCDILINEPMVSRHHAKIVEIGKDFFLEDLNSSNGTFADGNKITERTKISQETVIHIGPAILKWGQTIVNSERAIQASGIHKIWKGKYGLHPLNFSINKGEFIALMGPSGCGKSTLLKLLSNYTPITGGEILINGENIFEGNNWKRLQHAIGYVDQNDESLMADLTVLQTMYYAGKLRLPQQTSDIEINKRTEVILTKLSLAKEAWSNKISQLSGGQRKKVCIAVELISEPQILFLDEPTSPLDPQSIGEFLNTIKALAKDRAVLMVTHKPDDLKFVDKVFFLGKGGYHVFSGTYDHLLKEHQTNDILTIYSRYSSNEHSEFSYKKLYSQVDQKEAKFQNTNTKNESGFLHQYYWSARRYFQAKKAGGLQTLAIVSLLLPAISFLAISKFIVAVPFMIVILSIFLGLFNGIEEVIYDRKTFFRERKINMRIGSYYLSKLTVVGIFCIIQSLLISTLAILRYPSDSENLTGLNSFFGVFALCFGLSFSSTIAGLMISSVSSRLNQAVYTLLFVLIVQILFAGTFTKIDVASKEIISFTTFSRWGMQAFSHMQNNEDNQGKILTYSPNFDTIVQPVRMVTRNGSMKDTAFVSLMPTKSKPASILTGVHPMAILEFYPEWSFDKKSDDNESSSSNMDEEISHNKRSKIKHGNKDHNQPPINNDKKVKNKDAYQSLLPESFRSGFGGWLAILFLDIIFSIITIRSLSKNYS